MFEQFVSLFLFLPDNRAKLPDIDLSRVAGVKDEKGVGDSFLELDNHLIRLSRFRRLRFARF